jgi:serine/threonine-protein kinase HipA
MATTKTNIFVYAHWLKMQEPKLIGILGAQQAKGRKAFSFEYDKEWISSKEQVLLDPDIAWYTGQQYPVGKENFGMIFDSMPDTWGRTLMKKRAAQKAKEDGMMTPVLHDIDFLLGVFDECRMGGIRIKLEKDGPFLDNNPFYSIPHLSRIRELQYAAEAVETDSQDLDQWLAILMAPGSSLGGARPKANVVDELGNLWIAKFPSKTDNIDKGAWEFVAYKLAVQAGIEMAESRIERVAGKHHTFFTKRFDRNLNGRIHFASAMTMTGNNEDTIRDHPASYLDIAEFIQFAGAQNKKDLHQLCRRMVFNMAISNTDDHLRNHGFLLGEKGWILSPAFDINPSTDKYGLALTIDSHSNALDFDLAKSVGEFFKLNNQEMNEMIEHVLHVTKNWRHLAQSIGIARSEQEMMEPAFYQKSK